MKRTQAEIDAEIKAIRALKPVGKFAARTSGTLDVLVEFLQGEIDTTAEEFLQMPYHRQMVIGDAELWLSGDSDSRPSKGWQGLAE